jgi:hypothetical protein
MPAAVICNIAASCQFLYETKVASTYQLPRKNNDINRQATSMSWRWKQQRKDEHFLFGVIAVASLTSNMPAISTRRLRTMESKGVQQQSERCCLDLETATSIPVIDEIEATTSITLRRSYSSRG